MGNVPKRQQPDHRKKQQQKVTSIIREKTLTKLYKGRNMITFNNAFKDKKKYFNQL